MEPELYVSTEITALQINDKVQIVVEIEKPSSVASACVGRIIFGVRRGEGGYEQAILATASGQTLDEVRAKTWGALQKIGDLLAVAGGENA